MRIWIDSFIQVPRYVPRFQELNKDFVLLHPFPRQTVQPSSQCKRHDAGARTQPMNEAYGAQLRPSTSSRRSTRTIDEAYGAQHSRSTRGGMFQDRCRRVARNKAHFHGTLSSTTFPAAARQKPLTRYNRIGRYISPSGESELADRASTQASKWAPRCSRCSATAPKHVICQH